MLDADHWSMRWRERAELIHVIVPGLAVDVANIRVLVSASLYQSRHASRTGERLEQRNP